MDLSHAIENGELPVDRLKLDKSLIRRLTTERKDAVIVRSIIALAKDLGVSVIAEGVETEQQLRMLQELGCLQVQGYLLARPGPPEGVQALLTSRWGTRRCRVIAELDATLRQQGRAALDRFGDVSPQFRQSTGPVPYSGMRRRIDHLKLDDAADELVNGALPQASAT